MIELVDGEEINWEVPISANATYVEYWQPVIAREGFPWLQSLLSPGFDVTEEELPEVLAEVRRLKEAVPRYYPPESIGYQHMQGRLAYLITRLEELTGKKVVLFFG